MTNVLVTSQDTKHNGCHVTNLTAAIEYARLGYRVLPVVPLKKHPLVSGGVHAATADETTIREWWQRWPNANVGIAADRAVVIDVDEGADWPAGERKRLEIKATRCPLARTPSGGFHLWFRRPADRDYRPSASVLASHVDVRAGPSYVIVPPSRTELGGYHWIRPLVPPDSLPLPPEWLIVALDKVASQRHQSTTPERPDDLIVLTEGQRNDGLFRLACRLRRAGLTETEIRHALHEANALRCSPPLTEREVESIARSACRYPAGTVPTVNVAMQRAWARGIHWRRKRTGR